MDLELTMSGWHECFLCDRNFVSQQALESHWIYSSRHSWCQRCQEHFSSEEDRAQHENESSQHHICHRCGLDFESDHNLDHHRLNDDSHNWCHDCNRDFDTPSHLQQHSIVHLPRDIRCFGCSRYYTTYSAMLIHLESANCVTTPEEMDHFAQKCYQSAKYVTPGCEHYLRAQSRYETRAEGIFNLQTQRFECRECYKPFQTDTSMRQHVDSPVHDSLAYQCPGCRMNLTTLSGLVQHVESASCHETINQGSGSIGKMLRFLQVVLADKARLAN